MGPGSRPGRRGGKFLLHFSKSRSDASLRSRGMFCPRSAKYSSLLDNRAQGRPGARCTRGLVCKLHNKKTHTSIQVQRKHSGLPRAMVLRLISRSPWRPGFLATIASRNNPQDLTPASGRRDHTTSPSASRAVRQWHISVHRIPPHVRDDRAPPLFSGETGELIALICPTP